MDPEWIEPKIWPTVDPFIFHLSPSIALLFRQPWNRYSRRELLLAAA